MEQLVKEVNKFVRGYLLSHKDLVVERQMG